MNGCSRRYSKCCNRSSRRPWQDHAGQRHASAVPCVQRARGSADRRHGLQRPGAREGHHHPRKEHGRRVHRTACREIRSPGGHHDQRHRHARPRRFRRRGGARHLDGRRRRATRRCLGGPAATDPFRAAQGARGQAAGHPVREQGGSSRRSHRGGRGRGLRSAAWLGAGCDRGGCGPRPRLTARPAGDLLRRQGGLCLREPAGRWPAARQRQSGTVVRRDHQEHPGPRIRAGRTAAGPCGEH